MTRSPRTNRLAFTLTELLVVISLIVLLLAIAVPAFSSMLYNNDRTLAMNQLRVAIATARDQAIRSDGGDTAAVFFFEPGGKARIVTCVQIAKIDDLDPDGGPAEGREVFVPVPLVSPIELPKGWVIRGYVPPLLSGSDVDRWYGSSDGAFQVRYSTFDGCWVFPETGFYPRDVISGNRRTSFMVRFQAGTGQLVATAPADEALVVDIAGINGALREGGTMATHRIDQSPDLGAFVRRTLDPLNWDLNDTQKRELLGDASPDTVLVRSVSQLAVMDERRMVAQLDQGPGQLNRATGCIYGVAADPTAVPILPQIDTSLFNGAAAVQVNQWIAQWINGTYQGRYGTANEAHIFTVDRASGLAREVIQ